MISKLFMRLSIIAFVLVVILIVGPIDARAQNNSLYYNSSEPGCDGSDPTILFCDDFEDGVWAMTNCDTDGGPDNPDNDGWCMTIFADWPDPEGTGYGRCGGLGAGGTNCVATSEVISPSPGGNIFGEHYLAPDNTGYDEIYVRWYQKELPGFVAGHEKILFIQNSFQGEQFFGLSKSFGNNVWAGIGFNGDPGWLFQNQGNNLKVVPGNWYYAEVYLKLNDPGSSNGEYRLWMDNCGEDGLGCTGPGTLRAEHTGLDHFRSSNTKLTTLWFENWGNESSVGEEYYDQIVSSTKRIGPMITTPPIPDTSPPTTPTNLSAQGISQSSIQLIWTASSDDRGVVSYSIFRNDVLVGSLPSQTFTDTGLIPSTTYSYTVQALDLAGNSSPQSQIAQGTTLEPDIIPPTTPTNLRQQVLTSTSVELLWDASTDNVSVTSYNVYRGGELVGSSNSSQIEDTELNPLTQYVYAVTALDSAGNESLQSDSLSVTTLEAPPIPEGLAAAYTFSENQGTTIEDVSGNNRTGTLQGPQWVLGDTFGPALQFDGQEDFVDIGSFDLTGDELTLMAWINPESHGNDARILSKANGGQETNHWWMMSFSSQSLRTRIKAGGSTDTLVGSGSIPLNEWTHVAAVYNGQTMELYQNGNSIGQMNKSGQLDQNPNIAIHIGNNPGDPRPFDGAIDEVAIFQKALTAQEIQDVMTNGLEGGSSTNEELRADVDQDSQITIVDAALTQRKALGLDMSGTSWVDQPETGDSDCNNQLSIVDAALIQQRSLGVDMSQTPYCGT